MNVLYVLDRFPAVSETFVLHELLELERQGDAVHVAARRGPAPGEPVHASAGSLAARTVYLPGPLRSASAAAAALLRRPRRALPALAWCLRARLAEPDALRSFAEAAWLAAGLPAGVEHVHAHFAAGTATRALVLGRLTGLPFSFTGHARDLFAASHPGVLRRKIREAQLVVAPSEYTRAHLSRVADPADRGRIALVRYGVAGRARAGRTADGPPLVLTVARLVEKKGIDTAIAAASLLRAQGVAHRWLVVGDGPLRARLEPAARAAGVELVGARDEDEVQALHAEAAVFALPCRVAPDGDRDSLPVALLEAAAAGNALVSTAVGGVPEVVRHGETGLLVPPDDADALAAAVGRLLADGDLRQLLARRARAAVGSYDLAASVARLRASLGAAA